MPGNSSNKYGNKGKFNHAAFAKQSKFPYRARTQNFNGHPGQGSLRAIFFRVKGRPINWYHLWPLLFLVRHSLQKLSSIMCFNSDRTPSKPGNASCTVQILKKRSGSTARLKGQCHEIFVCVFSSNKLLLVPSHMPRKDFEFCWIFVELFVFIIDPLLPRGTASNESRLPGHLPQLSCDSLVYSSPKSRDLPVMNNRSKLLSKKTCWCQIHQEVMTPLWMNRGGLVSLLHADCFL